MNKYRITYPNNKEVREYKSRTTKGNTAYGVSLPPERIVTGTRVYNNYLAKGRFGTSLLQHEYGHILQAKEYGLKAYYDIIAPESLISMTFNKNHNRFWTEILANNLSVKYFGNRYISDTDFPQGNVNPFNILLLMLNK